MTSRAGDYTTRFVVKVRVTGLSGAELQALNDARPSGNAWLALVRVGVSGNDTAAVVGDYVIDNGALEFRPRFPLDRGQPYSVRFHPGRLPTPRTTPVVEATVSIPAPDLKPSTVVTAITPSSDTWPELGRAIRDRGRYTIAIDPAWRDASGQPLKEGYRREVRVGLPIERPLTPADWRVTAPNALTRNSLRVTFPWALDQALLQNAISVYSAGAEVVPGAISTDADETQWVFTPAAPWRRGAHQLRVLTLLEDPSGNQVGRAFEMKPGTAADPRPEPEVAVVPFAVGAPR